MKMTVVMTTMMMMVTNSNDEVDSVADDHVTDGQGDYDDDDERC